MLDVFNFYYTMSTQHEVLLELYVDEELVPPVALPKSLIPPPSSHFDNMVVKVASAVPRNRFVEPAQPSDLFSDSEDSVPGEEERGDATRIDLTKAAKVADADTGLVFSRTKQGSRRKSKHIPPFRGTHLEPPSPIASQRSSSEDRSEISGFWAFLGDKQMMFQVIVQLVDNAIKHSPAGAKVTISLQRKRISDSDLFPYVAKHLRKKLQSMRGKNNLLSSVTSSGGPTTRTPRTGSKQARSRSSVSGASHFATSNHKIRMDAVQKQATVSVQHAERQVQVQEHKAQANPQAGTNDEKLAEDELMPLHKSNSNRSTKERPWRRRVRGGRRFVGRSRKLPFQSLCTDCFVISIKDQGKGISKDRMEGIFEPFEKIDERFSGLGLGLAITKRFVSMLDLSLIHI